MLFEIEINEFGKKYSFVPKTGTEDDWRDIASFFTIQFPELNGELNTIGLSVEDGEQIVLKVSEKAFETLKNFVDNIDEYKLDVRRALCKFERTVILFKGGNVHRLDVKDAAYSYLQRVGLMTESDIPLLKTTKDVTHFIKYCETKNPRHIEYWRDDMI